MSQDNYKNESIVDQEILKKLDNGFRRLTWARRQFSRSLLKRFLTKSVFRTLKYRKTENGFTLHDIAKSGFEHLDANIGVYAFDSDCYTVFKPLLHSIICSINQVTPKIIHSKISNWTDIDHVEVSIDPEGKYIDKICMTLSRNIQTYPFVPAMSVKQLESLEREIKANLKSMSCLTGVCYSLSTMPKDVQQILKRDDIMFDDTDKFYASAGIYHHWPIGRGLFVSHLKDLFVWINESEHFKLGVVQKDGNLKSVFQRLMLNVENFWNYFKWVQDEDNLGYITMSPALIGSGLKIYVYIKLPYLGLEEAFRLEILDQHGLECVSSKQQFTLSNSKIFVLANKRTFGLTESEILSNINRGLREMIAIENKYKHSAKVINEEENE